jgi:hypothetical protein
MIRTSTAQTGANAGIASLREVLSRNLQEEVLPPRLKLVPQLNEVYEIELAYYESRILSDEEIIRNGAYFL